MPESGCGRNVNADRKKTQRFLTHCILCTTYFFWYSLSNEPRMSATNETTEDQEQSGFIDPGLRLRTYDFEFPTQGPKSLHIRTDPGPSAEAPDDIDGLPEEHEAAPHRRLPHARPVGRVARGPGSPQHPTRIERRTELRTMNGNIS